MLYIIFAVAFLVHLIEGQSNVRCKDLVLDWDKYYGELSQDGKVIILHKMIVRISLADSHKVMHLFKRAIRWTSDRRVSFQKASRSVDIGS